MTGYFALAPRALSREDHVAARVLLMGALGVTPYVDRAMEVLQLAERGAGHDEEHRALVIARDGTVAALVLFGTVAGASGVLKLHVVVVAPNVSADEVGERIVSAVVDEARTTGMRLIVAELPDDPVVGRMRALLGSNGFEEEARVADYFRDGIALMLLRRAV
jgi:ribosomal protein S18 acetylase RimI-like enzyme